MSLAHSVAARKGWESPIREERIARLPESLKRSRTARKAGLRRYWSGRRGEGKWDTNKLVR